MGLILEEPPAGKGRIMSEPEMGTRGERIFRENSRLYHDKGELEDTNSGALDERRYGWHGDDGLTG